MDALWHRSKHSKQPSNRGESTAGIPLCTAKDFSVGSKNEALSAVKALRLV